MKYLVLVIALLLGGCKEEKPKPDIEADKGGWYNGGGGAFGGRGQPIDRSGLVQAVPLLPSATPTPTQLTVAPTNTPIHSVPDGSPFIPLVIVIVIFIWFNREKL